MPIRTLLLLAAAAILAYAPAMTIPLIADDYPLIAHSIENGSPQAVPSLLSDATFRLRATSSWAIFALWQVGEVTAWVYHAASLLLHIGNTWLVFAVLSAWRRMAPAAAWAAFFFTIHEGHQEAVMWFAAINELLMFFFGMASLWCWLRGRDAASAVLFAFALLSKESAIVLLPLFLLTGDAGRWKRLLPHAVLAALAAISVAQSHANSFRFNDGSFDLHAPFWITWPRSFGRLLWIWGLLAGAGIWLTRDRELWRSAGRALVWIGVAMTPYSFLTYMTQIPSRQTYLASAGLAMLVGLAVSRVRDRRAIAALATVMVVHNVGYLWTKKRAQFMERAAPTAELIALAERTRGRIWVRCFPLPSIDAEQAVRLAAGRSPDMLVWTETPGAVEFCFQEK